MWAQPHPPLRWRSSKHPLPVCLLQPKIGSHCGQCSASSFTCIDCSRQFNRHTVQTHTQCVTEHEKYAQGATKPGGFAEKGFYSDGAAKEPAAAGQAEGLEFLATRAPWVCSVCKVTCTSHPTLLAHAQGVKHKRRSKAALAVKAGDAQQDAEPAAEPARNGNAAAATEEPAVEGAGAAKDAAAAAATNGHAANGSSSSKAPKWKKLAAAQLKRQGGTMKCKKLLAAVLAEAGESAGGADGDAVLAQLQQSKKFVVEGKKIRLV